MVYVLVVYGIMLIGIALLSLKYNKSFESFLVAGRRQPRYLIVASMLASTIGGGIVIGTVGKAYAMGFAAFWFVAAGSLAHFLQGALLSRRVRETQALTLPDLAEKLGGAGVQKLVALVIVFTWIGIAGGQFLAASKVIATMSGIDPRAAVAIATAFLLVYTLIGGQKSVLRTDLLQFGILAASVLISVAWLFLARPPAPGSLALELFSPKFGPLDLAYYLVVVAGSYFICPMMFGRILSSDSPENARKASFISGAGMLLFAFAITFIGLWARASGFDAGKLDPLNAIVKGVLPAPLGAAMLLGMLAAILSTADTVLLTAAGILEHDLLGSSSLPRTRLWVVAIAALGGVIALYKTDLIGLLLSTYQGYTSGLVPALFVAIMASGKRRLAPRWLFAAILGGYLLGFGGNFLPDPNRQKLAAFAGLALSTLLALVAYRRGEAAAEA
ncbi:MAG TPA: sodium:solute symporter family protein [Spirochaetales bacterium]|nr:sodium:solute symporter family protein [Spirochaetales bacterium]HRY56053.1 sodium:solute symporter family protein [Spirochaetia bacterium]HRZ64777.1 sodium:solute symporter family protein [Spirochaetia bacterium]